MRTVLQVDRQHQQQRQMILKKARDGEAFHQEKVREEDGLGVTNQKARNQNGDSEVKHLQLLHHIHGQRTAGE